MSTFLNMGYYRNAKVIRNKPNSLRETWEVEDKHGGDILENRDTSISPLPYLEYLRTWRRILFLPNARRRAAQAIYYLNGNFNRSNNVAGIQDT